MYGGNGHFQYSKSNNSKSWKARVTVHVFCMSSHGVNICDKFHEYMSSSFKCNGADTKIVDRHTHTKKKTIYPIACILCMPGV